jgi:ABC-2 type transport system permease protein
VLRPDRRYWNLLREFTLCWFKLRDQGSVMGFLWTLLHPLVLLLLLYTLFGERLGGGVPHFRIYVLIGIVHWSFFATATGKAVTSLTQRVDLVANTSFPRVLLVFSDVGSVLISFVLEVLVLLAFVVVEGLSLGSACVALPVVIALEAIFVVGVSLALAALQVFVVDVQRIWAIVLRIGFFGVPIFWPMAMLEGNRFRMAFELNPLTQFMSFTRSALIDGTGPSVGWLAYTVAVSLLLFALALALFKRAECRFAERL